MIDEQLKISAEVDDTNPWADVPERNLLVRVFTQAIQDATFEPTRRQVENPYFRNAYPNDSVKREAVRWLHSNDTEPMSARWICTHLEIDISLVRLKLARDPRGIRKQLFHKPTRGES